MLGEHLDGDRAVQAWAVGLSLPLRATLEPSAQFPGHLLVSSSLANAHVHTAVYERAEISATVP